MVSSSYHQMVEGFFFEKYSSNSKAKLLGDQELEASLLLVMRCYFLCGQIFIGAFSTEERENWLMEKNLAVRFKLHCKDASNIWRVA